MFHLLIPIFLSLILLTLLGLLVTRVIQRKKGERSSPERTPPAGSRGNPGALDERPGVRGTRDGGESPGSGDEASGALWPSVEGRPAPRPLSRSPFSVAFCREALSRRASRLALRMRVLGASQRPQSQRPRVSQRPRSQNNVYSACPRRDRGAHAAGKPGRWVSWLAGARGTTG